MGRLRSMTYTPVSDCLGEFSPLQKRRSKSCNDAFDDGTPETRFRRWECDAAKPGGAEEGPIPGLRGAFKKAGLASYDCLAEIWCRDNGAAFITELVECE